MQIYFHFLFLLDSHLYKTMIFFFKSEYFFLCRSVWIIYPFDFWFIFCHIPFDIINTKTWASFSLDDLVSKSIIKCMSYFLLNRFNDWFEGSPCSHTEEFSSESEDSTIDRIFCHSFKIIICV